MSDTRPISSTGPWRSVALAVLPGVATLILGQVATFPNLAPWYLGLAKPSFNPPNWLFGPAWSLLYTLMALAAVFVAARGQALRIALIAALFAALYFTDSRSSWITVLIVVATGIYMKAATFREIGIALVCTLAIVLPRRRAVV